MPPKKKTAKQDKSAKTERFVSSSTAKKNPSTTYKQNVKKKSGRK